MRRGRFSQRLSRRGSSLNQILFRLVVNSQCRFVLLAFSCFHNDITSRRLRTQTLDLKSRVYSITTFREDCLELLRGTSSYIGETCEYLQKLRARVVVRVLVLALDIVF